MDSLPIPANDDGRLLARVFLGRFDAPAFARRARDVEGAWRELLERCRLLREAMLEFVKLRLGTLRALCGDWQALDGLTADVDVLRRLEATLTPVLRLPVRASASPSAWRRALAELCDSMARFNRLWPGALGGVDLGPINRLREDYNRYYLVEKECALGSARMARQGFERLRPVTLDDLCRAFPPLPLPRLAGDRA